MDNIDGAIESIGSFGWWHLFVYLWMMALVFFRSMVGLAIIFMQDTPDFICKSGLLSNGLANWTFQQAKNISTPNFDNSMLCGCQMYKLNYSLLEPLGFEASLQLIPRNKSDLELVPCTNGHYYDKKAMENSVITQWDLVCDRAVWIAHTQTAYVMGIGIGLCFSGILADKFGRKPVIIGLGVVSSIVALVDAFSANFYLFLLLRFVLGVFRNGTALYTLAFELGNLRLRNLLSAFYWTFYSAGAIGLAVLAYFVRDWRLMHALSTTPLIVMYPLCYWILPESPRWLASKGRTKEAMKILQRIAKFNNKDFDVARFRSGTSNSLEIGPAQGSDVQQISYYYFVKNTTQLIRLLIVFCIWFANALVFSGILLLITGFSGNIFIHNAISGASDFPAYILVYLLLLWSRKKSQIFCLLLAALVLFSTQLIPASFQTLELVAALFGKLVITASYSLTYVVTSELYPSSVRAGFLLSADMVGTIGGMSAPYLANIAKLFPYLDPIKTPLLVFAIVSVFAAVVEMFLPETQGRKIPEAIDELP